MIESILAGAAAAAAIPAAGASAYRTMRQRRVARRLTIDTPNGIDEQRFVRLGGIEQWIGIRGEDRNNPVLLVLHGGPGSPYSIFTPLIRSWEKHFTVVQWDRRGVGKTLGRTGKKGSGEMTFPRMVADGLELTEYLRGHLGKDAIVLMGGSAGNLVGLPMVKARPDLFCAYVGTDIVNNMARTQALAYRRAGERLRAAGNARGLSALEKISPDPTQWNVAAWTRVQQWLMKTDPVTPSFDRKVIMPLMFTSPAHTIRQVGHIGTGLSFAPARLFDQFMAFDAEGLGTQFQVPFFVFQGETDVINSTELAREYYSRIEAPHKEWVVIKDAGHFCAFVQPDRFLAEMLTRVRPFAAASLRH